MDFHCRAHALYSPQYIETLIDKSLALDADGVGGQLVTDVLSKTSTSIAIKIVLSSYRYGAIQCSD